MRRGIEVTKKKNTHISVVLCSTRFDARNDVEQRYGNIVCLNSGMSLDIL